MAFPSNESNESDEEATAALRINPGRRGIAWPALPRFLARLIPHQSPQSLVAKLIDWCFAAPIESVVASSRRWPWVRWELAERKIAVPPRLEVRMVVVIEEGAVFFDLFKPDPTRRGWYAFAPVEAHRYQVSVLEAEDPAERNTAGDLSARSSDIE